MQSKARMGSAVPRGCIGPPITSRKGLTTMAIRLVVFDVGETLIDESRMWGEWADWLGVPRAQRQRRILHRSPDRAPHVDDAEPVLQELLRVGAHMVAHPARRRVYRMVVVHVARGY